MLIIQNDPAGITGRKRYPWDMALTVHENIASHLERGGDAQVYLNGHRINPLTDWRMDARPTAADFVTVTLRPSGLELATWAYIALAGMTVYAYASMQRLPGLDASAAAKDSPNNQLTGQTNVARAYQALPDVYGYRRVWPDLIQPSSVEYIDNVKYITEWLCVSRGHGDITDVQYAETPLTEIDGADFSVFEPDSSPSAYPELNYTTLTNVVETFASSDVNGQELPYAVGASSLVISRSALISTTISTGNFSLTMADGSSLNPIKAVVGTSINVAEPIFGIDEACTLLGYTTSGSDVTFNFAASSHVFAVTQTGYSVYASIVISGFLPSTTTVGYFTLPLDSEGIRYNVVFLRGLKGTVDVDVEWWQIDGAGDEISGSRSTISESFTADTFDQCYFTREHFPLTGVGRYRVQFTRTNVASSDGSDVAKLENLYAVRKYATKTLPGVTVMRVTTKATEQATGIRERKFNLRWQRHIRTLTTDTLSASRNFARAMAHLWCVAGEDIAELDTTTLAAINTEIGEASALLRFDGSLDDADVSLGERLQMIANAARCTLWRDGTQWTVTRDQARTTPEVQFDYRNLASGGESAISYAAHLPASHDGLELEYTDEVTQATKAYIRLDISGGYVDIGASANPLKMKLPGCASLAQAENRAHLEARRLLYQRTTVQDKALADGGALGIGSLVRWIDPNDFAGDDGLQAGEVMSVDGALMTTSEPLEWHGESSGRIMFTGTDGAPLGAPVTCTPSGSDVTLSSVPVGLFVRSSAWQLGSRYAFSAGLTEAETEAAGLYVVTELSPAADRTVALTLAQYDARMYSADSSTFRSVSSATETDTAVALGFVIRFDYEMLTTETDTAMARQLVAYQEDDPEFANVLLLAHMDGTHGSTTFTDSSSYAHTLTAVGNAQISTAQAKFGAAATMSGTDGYVRIGTAGAVSSDWQTLFAGDYTIEGWVWVNPADTGTGYISLWSAAYIDMSAGPSIEMYVGGSGTLSLVLRIGPYQESIPMGSNRLAPLTDAPADGTWIHWAVCGGGGKIRMFLNGRSMIYRVYGSYTYDWANVTPSAPPVDGTLRIGCQYALTAGTYVDEVRVTKGVARYTGSFDPIFISGVTPVPDYYPADFVPIELPFQSS